LMCYFALLKQPLHVEPVVPKEVDKEKTGKDAAMYMAKQKPFSAVWTVAAPMSTLLLKDTCAVLDRYALAPAEVVSLQQQQQQQQQQCDVHHLGLCTLTPDNTYYNVRYTPPLQCPQRLLQQPSMSVPDATAVALAARSRYTQVVVGFVIVGVVVVVVVSCGKLFFRVIIAVVETAITGMLNQLHAGAHVQVDEVHEPHHQELDVHALEAQVSSNCDMSRYSAHAWQYTQQCTCHR
jgi:hypothetical protein